MAEPITLETAGELIGGERPISRKTVERIIAAGLLHDYGRGATRRVLRQDVERLIDQLGKGEVTWPPRKTTAAVPEKVVSTSTPKARGNGSRKNGSKVS